MKNGLVNIDESIRSARNVLGEDIKNVGLRFNIQHLLLARASHRLKLLFKKAVLNTAKERGQSKYAVLNDFLLGKEQLIFPEGGFDFLFGAVKTGDSLLDYHALFLAEGMLDDA